MSLHDTLAGLRAELDGYIRTGRDDRASQVEAEIARVEELLDTEPEAAGAEDLTAAIDADRAAAYITALTEERAGYAAVGRADRVAAVDAELARLGVGVSDDDGGIVETADGAPAKRPAKRPAKS